MAYVPRSRLAQLFQMGPTTANYRFPSLAVPLNPAGGNVQQYRHAGGKQVGSVGMGDLWSEGSNTSNLDMNELTFIAASNIVNASPSGSGPYTRVFSQNPDQPDSVAVYAVERGSNGAKKTFSGVQFPDLGLHFERTGPSTMTYRAIGRMMALSDGSLTSSTGVTQAPLSSIKTGLWVGDDYADLVSGPARVTPYGFNVDWHNNNRFGPDFVLDDSVTSYAFMTEGEVDNGGQMTLGFDVNSGETDFAGPLTIAKLQAGTPVFMRVKNTTGANVLTLDMCIVLSGPMTEAQVGNVMAYTFPYVCVPDATDNRAFKLTLVNAQPAIS